MFQVRSTLIRLHSTFFIGNNNHSKHINSRGFIKETHENADEFCFDGHGTIRHVHAIISRSLAFLHVHIWQSLQTVVACRRVLFMERNERRYTCIISHGIDMVDISIGCTKVRTVFLIPICFSEKKRERKQKVNKVFKSSFIFSTTFYFSDFSSFSK